MHVTELNSLQFFSLCTKYVDELPFLFELGFVDEKCKFIFHTVSADLNTSVTSRA